MNDEEKINAIMKILTEWNPLGDEDVDIPNLDNYSIEAADILCTIDLLNANTEAKVTSVVKDVLNQAFDLSLTKTACLSAGKKIYLDIK